MITAHRLVIDMNLIARRSAELQSLIANIEAIGDDAVHRLDDHGHGDSFFNYSDSGTAKSIASGDVIQRRRYGNAIDSDNTLTQRSPGALRIGKPALHRLARKAILIPRRQFGPD
jgi:hypothetical protein